MILQRIRIIVGDAGFEPGTSAPEVWCAKNEPPHPHSNVAFPDPAGSRYLKKLLKILQHFCFFEVGYGSEYELGTATPVLWVPVHVM